MGIINAKTQLVHVAVISASVTLLLQRLMLKLQMCTTQSTTLSTVQMAALTKMMMQIVFPVLVPASQSAVNRATKILLSSGTTLTTINAVLTEQSFQMAICAKISDERRITSTSKLYR